jgi:hypothetical protein
LTEGIPEPFAQVMDATLREESSQDLQPDEKKEKEEASPELLCGLMCSWLPVPPLPPLPEPTVSAQPPAPTDGAACQPIPVGESVLDHLKATNQTGAPPPPPPAAAQEGIELPDVLKPIPPQAAEIPRPLPPPTEIPVRDELGMDAAKFSVQMAKAEKTGQNAGKQAQTLPNSATFAGEAGFLRVLPVKGPALKASPDEQLATYAQISASTPGFVGHHFPMEGETVVETTRLQTLEKSVVEAAVTFKTRDLDHMEVVIKPDAHTEVHLRLEQGAQGVEIEARIKKGDIEHLQSNWDQLQTSLHNQGIRLRPLEESRESMPHNAYSSQHPSHSRREHAEHERSTERAQPRISKGASPVAAKPAVARRANEYWA